MRSSTARFLLPVLLAGLGLFAVFGLKLGGAAGAPASDGYNFLADAGLGPARRPARETPPGPVTGQAVLGTDERIEIIDTESYPWSAIVYLELYDMDGYAGSCSGTFIGPDTVLTAAHCLYSEGAWIEDVVVVPGKSGDYEPFGWEYAENWWVPDAWIDLGEPSEWDWGVIKMEDSFLGDLVGYLYVANLLTATLEQDDFGPAIVGYPGDKPEGTMWGGIVDAFLEVGRFQLTYFIDTAPGQSGSAIISTQDGPLLGAIVGVHTQGQAGFNSGSRVDEELLDDILLACDVMFCTVDYYVEPESGATPTSTPTATATPTPTNTPVPPLDLERRGLVPGLTRAN